MSALLQYLTPDVLFILVGVLAALAVISTVYVVASFNVRERAQRRARLERAANRRGAARPNEEALTLRKTDPTSRFDRFFRPFLPNPEKLRTRLRQTGRKISLGQFGLSILISGLVGFGVVWRLGGLPPLNALVAGLAIGLVIPNLAVTMMVNKRRNKFLDSLADGIDVMVRGLKAGLPVSETVVAVANESKEPVKGVFKDVADRIRVGAQVDEAIVNAAENIAASELKFLAITLSVQKETGGNLAETLENLSEILRKRRQMKLKIKAVSSEARASATILGSLPFVMFLILLAVNTGYVMELFNDPRGHVLLAFGVGSMLVGIGVMVKMVKFEI